MIYSKFVTGYNELYRSKLYASNCKKSGLHTRLEKSAVRSESGPENTIIDCEGNGRGFYFRNVSDIAELEGFKIINGRGGCGGGILCDHSSPSITNCEISGNSAAGSGGGICGSSSSITNCAIIGNNVGNAGGGIYSSYSSPSITNCTIAWNGAYQGGGIYCYSSSPSITNCILYLDSADKEIVGSATVTYSDVMGGYTGEGNIDEDPLFVGGGDYHLQGNSPCIDVATPEGAPDTDIDGELRPQGTGYDMGADEFEGVPPPPPCKGDFDNNGDVDGSDLAVFAAEFGRTDCPCER